MHLYRCLLSCLLAVELITFSARGVAQDAGSTPATALVGVAFGPDYVLTIEDIRTMEPVCQLIASYYAKGGAIWYEQLKGNPILDRPEYNMAKDVLSYHHICWGDLAGYRAWRERNPAKRNAYLIQSAGEYGFVIEHADWRPADWPHLSKLYVRRGKALALLKKDAEALGAFLEALKIDKANRDAYVALADFMQEKKQPDQALKYVREGLRYHPEAKSLQRRYKELGGKPPYPDPYPPIIVQPAGTGSTQKEGGAKGDDLGGVVPAESTVIKSESKPEDASNQSEGAAQAIPAAEIKAPVREQETTTESPVTPDKKGRYCRFCPD